MTCPDCGFEAATGTFCIRCGARLSPDDRHPGARGYAAAPTEHHLRPRVVSTLFPHLPHASMELFWVLLVAGAGLIAALALAGLYPVALIASAVVVPVLVVVYFVEVDLYEDEPWRVLAFTIAWGIGAGIAVGFLAEAVREGDATLQSQTTSHAVVWNGILIPLIGLALVLGGPLVLLRYRKFNDVLDGVTFGGACAVTFAGAELLTHSSTFLAAGIEPPGLVTPWTVRLLTLGIAVPVLAAAAVGAASGALWLHYRAPKRDRGKLGVLGHPALAVPLAAVLLVGSALLQLYLDRWAALAAVIALGLVALIWLRQLIHLGLVEEAEEIEIGSPEQCANCGRETPRHTFCAHCGVSLRALPKSGPAHRRSWARAAGRFAVGLALLLAIGAVVTAAVEPGSAQPPCKPQQPCVQPPPTGPGPVVQTRTWTSGAGVALAYDMTRWRVDSQSAGRLSLVHDDDLALRIDVTRDATPPERQLAEALDSLRGRYNDLELDSDPAHQIASPAIGPVAGIGETFAGHDADMRPVEVLIEVAAEGGTTVVATVWTSQQAHTSASGLTTPFDVLAEADAVLQSVRWPGQAGGGRA